jgi:hypothetical protein
MNRAIPWPSLSIVVTPEVAVKPEVAGSSPSLPFLEVPVSRQCHCRHNLAPTCARWVSISQGPLYRPPPKIRTTTRTSPLRELARQQARRWVQRPRRPASSALRTLPCHFVIRLRADDGPERSVLVRVSVAVPGDWAGRRRGAYDLPVARECGGTGTKTWRHSPLTGCTIVKGSPGAAKRRKAPQTPSAAILFRI